MCSSRTLGWRFRICDHGVQFACIEVGRVRGIGSPGAQFAGVGDGAAVPVLSCNVMSSHVVSCRVVSCHVAVARHVASSHVMSVVPRRVASCRMALCRTAFCCGCHLDSRTLTLPSSTPHLLTMCVHTTPAFFADDSHSPVFHPRLTISTSHVGLSGPFIQGLMQLWALSYI